MNCKTFSVIFLCEGKDSTVLILAWFYLELLTYKNWLIILKEAFFYMKSHAYKLLQHPRSVFSWKLDVSKLSVDIIHLMIILITGYFNYVEEQVTYSQHQFAYSSWFSWRHELSLCFDIGDSSSYGFLSTCLNWTYDALCDLVPFA